jgi:hypothetical protein
VDNLSADDLTRSPAQRAGDRNAQRAKSLPWWKRFWLMRRLRHYQRLRWLKMYRGGDLKDIPEIMNRIGDLEKQLGRTRYFAHTGEALEKDVETGGATLMSWRQEDERLGRKKGRKSRPNLP